MMKPLPSASPSLVVPLIRTTAGATFLVIATGSNDCGVACESDCAVPVANSRVKAIPPNSKCMTGPSSLSEIGGPLKHRTYTLNAKLGIKFLRGGPDLVSLPSYSQPKQTPAIHNTFYYLIPITHSHTT